MIAADARRPGPFAFDKGARLPCNSRPGRLFVEHVFDGARKRGRVVGGTKKPGLAMPNELSMPADVGGDENASLRHCLQRLQWRHQLGQATAATRIDEQVDEFIVSLHLGMWNATGKDDSPRQPERSRSIAQCGFLRSAAQQK